MIKVRILKNDEMPDAYAQGEYQVDLTKAYAELHPIFAAHLVSIGYAEYLASDVKAAEKKTSEAAENAPDFVQRETVDEIPAPLPTVGDVAPVPTEELTLAPGSMPETISDPPTPKKLKRGEN